VITSGRIATLMSRRTPCASAAPRRWIGKAIEQFLIFKIAPILGPRSGVSYSAMLDGNHASTSQIIFTPSFHCSAELHEYTPSRNVLPQFNPPLTLMIEYCHSTLRPALQTTKQPEVSLPSTLCQ
jgi:hypothetical protein